MRDEFHGMQTTAEVREMEPGAGLATTHRDATPHSQGTTAPAKQQTAAAQPQETSSLKHVEAQHILDLLNLYAGNRRKVAEAMGISERTLYRKLKIYGLS